MPLPTPSANGHGIRRGLYLAPFDELADPRVLIELAMQAESSGWDGLFLWDHIVWRAPVRAVADPWVALSAIAARTERLRLGPLVTPLSRRRVQKLARETVTLDHLSNGRLTLGVGLGSSNPRRARAIRGGRRTARTGAAAGSRAEPAGRALGRRVRATAGPAPEDPCLGAGQGADPPTSRPRCSRGRDVPDRATRTGRPRRARRGDRATAPARPPRPVCPGRFE